MSIYHVDKLEVLIQKVLPQVYDDSLSYTELLGKVLAKLNEIIEKTNEYFDTDLKVYVEEILTRWITDGTLATIINETVFNDLNTRVTTNTNNIGDKTILPEWLQTSLYQAVGMHNEYLKQFGINVCQPPYNVSGNAFYQNPVTGYWYEDAEMTKEATGVTDIINQAINDAISQGHNTVTVPSGFFYLDKTVIYKAGLRFLCGGLYYQEINGTVFRTKGDITAFSSAMVEDSGVECRSVHMSGFIVKGSNTKPEGKVGYGIDMTNVRYNVVFNSVGFKYFKYGFLLNGTWKANFHDCLAHYNEVGVYMENQVNRVTFYDCQFNQNTVSAAKINPAKAKCDGVTFFGCLIEKNLGHGMHFCNVEVLTIQNCYLEGNHWHSIYLDGNMDDIPTEIKNFIAINNRFYGNSNKSYSNSGIRIAPGTKAVTLISNFFDSFIDAGVIVELNEKIPFASMNNTFEDTPMLFKYVNESTGQRPINFGADYLNLNGAELRGATLEQFYNSGLPTEFNFEGRIAWDITNKCLVVFDGATWKKVQMQV